MAGRGAGRGATGGPVPSPPVSPPGSPQASAQVAGLQVRTPPAILRIFQEAGLRSPEEVVAARDSSDWQAGRRVWHVPHLQFYTWTEWVAYFRGDEAEAKKCWMRAMPEWAAYAMPEFLYLNTEAQGVARGPDAPYRICFGPEFDSGKCKAEGVCGLWLPNGWPAWECTTRAGSPPPRPAKHTARAEPWLICRHSSGFWCVQQSREAGRDPVIWGSKNMDTISSMPDQERRWALANDVLGPAAVHPSLVPRVTYPRARDDGRGVVHLRSRLTCVSQERAAVSGPVPREGTAVTLRKIPLLHAQAAAAVCEQRQVGRVAQARGNGAWLAEFANPGGAGAPLRLLCTARELACAGDAGEVSEDGADRDDEEGPCPQPFPQRYSSKEPAPLPPPPPAHQLEAEAAQKGKHRQGDGAAVAGAAQRGAEPGGAQAPSQGCGGMCGGAPAAAAATQSMTGWRQGEAAGASSAAQPAPWGAAPSQGYHGWAAAAHIPQGYHGGAAAAAVHIPQGRGVAAAWQGAYSPGAGGGYPPHQQAAPQWQWDGGAAAGGTAGHAPPHSPQWDGGAAAGGTAGHTPPHWPQGSGENWEERCQAAERQAADAQRQAADAQRQAADAVRRAAEDRKRMEEMCLWMAAMKDQLHGQGAAAAPAGRGAQAGSAGAQSVSRGSAASSQKHSSSAYLTDGSPSPLSGDQPAPQPQGHFPAAPHAPAPTPGGAPAHQHYVGQQQQQQWPPWTATPPPQPHPGAPGWPHPGAQPHPSAHWPHPSAHWPGAGRGRGRG